MQVVDVKLTQRSIDSGGSELNGVVAYTAGALGWSGVLAFKISLVLLLACYERSSLFDKALVGITSAYGLLTFYHFCLL